MYIKGNDQFTLKFNTCFVNYSNEEFKNPRL